MKANPLFYFNKYHVHKMTYLFVNDIKLRMEGTPTNYISTSVLTVTSNHIKCPLCIIHKSLYLIIVA